MITYSIRHSQSPPTDQEQEPENYGPWVKSGLPPGFVNVAVLVHNHTHFSVYCLWLLSCNSDSVEEFWQRQYALQNLSYFLSDYTESFSSTLIYKLF